MEIQYQTNKKQEFFRQAIRDLAQRNIASRVAEIDGATAYPEDLTRALRAGRLFGLIIPKENGGENAGFLDFCIMLEELSKVCCVSAALCSTQNLAARFILANGSKEQKDRYLPKMATGEIFCGFALDEPVAIRSNPAIEITGDGETYVLKGSRKFIANGDMAGLFAIFAGGSCFLVEKAAAGVSVSKIQGWTGCQARYGSEIMLDSCKVTRQNLLGNEGEADKVTSSILADVSCASAARAMGTAQGALDYAVQYSKDRVQFGRPVARFQAVSSMLATMAARTEAARQIVYKAASLIDQESADAVKISAMAKQFASEVAVQVTTDAVQVLGGYGYMRDYPVERKMRAAKLTQITDISSDVETLLVAKSLVG